MRNTRVTAIYRQHWRISQTSGKELLGSAAFELEKKAWTIIYATTALLSDDHEAVITVNMRAARQHEAMLGPSRKTKESRVASIPLGITVLTSTKLWKR